MQPTPGNSNNIRRAARIAASTAKPAPKARTRSNPPMSKQPIDDQIVRSMPITVNQLAKIKNMYGI